MHVIAGAYPALPTGPLAGEAAADFWRTILDHPTVDGLEIPYLQGLHGDDETWFLDQLRGGVHVITAVPVNAMRARNEPGYGLASANEEGRRAALGVAADVCAAVHRVVDAGAQVAAVALHSAPNRSADPAAGTAAALGQSLIEIGQWDWAGATLTIEHCDAAVADHPAEKGFLTLTDELQAITDSGLPVGVVINWARSVIEGRTTRTAVDHAQQARAAGRLTGVMFSGVAATGDAAWADGHLPPAPGHPETLLGGTEIAETLAAAGTDLAFLGAKVVARPSDETWQDRAAGVLAAVDAVRAGWEQAAGGEQTDGGEQPGR